jgi:hypothetical protein
VSTSNSPVRLNARLDTRPDGGPSRGLWLVKWLLLVPHLVVLFFLWVAFPVLTFVALVAILVSGRYPRPLFDFNLGVLRWTWRVWFYGYGGLGTDRYPPFSLDEEPDYPATLDIAYPERLSRGLVLVKWWLLAIPHYVVIAFFTGGGGILLWQWGESRLGVGGGLVAVLALFAGVALLFTGRYPRGIFDLVTGMNRWVLRVGAYAALMTDEYPPFRLDLGGADPAGPRVRPEPAERVATHSGGSAGRVVGVVAGVLALLLGFGLTAGGGALLWLDGHRGADGYLSTPVERFSDTGYALRFDASEISSVDHGLPGVDDVLGRVRIHVSGVDSGAMFAGIARTSDVAAYLGDVPHGRFTGPRTMPHAAPMMRMRPPAVPMGDTMWVASDTGTGELTVNWVPRRGEWSLVVMNASARRGVAADVTFAATAPSLQPIAVGILAGGIGLLVTGSLVIVFAARQRPRRR